MTRSNAREIAVHFTFELGFSDLNADELLERNMTEELFAQRAGEADLYAQLPDKPQGDYISALVRGVFSHGAELDGYIGQYAKGWRFSRIDRVAAANKKGLAKAIHLSVEEDQVTVEIALLVAYGYAVPTVARAVQDAIISAVENTSGLHVACVNVSVTGVIFHNK